MANKYILMLEGDADDRFLTKDTVKQAGLSVPFHFIENSNEVLSYLDDCVEQDKPLPSVIILNLLSTPEDGLTILKHIRANASYGSIPVVMLCEHAAGNMVNECYQHGANSVIQKPSSDELTFKKITSFISYWFDVVELPVISNVFN